MKINGIAHIVLTVNRPELALPFYERLFGFLELKTVFRHERGAYFIGGKTAVAIVPAETPHDQAAFVQTRIGLLPRLRPRGRRSPARAPVRDGR